MADSEEREALQQASLPIRMAAAMEAQLAANGHKSGWENMSSKWLLNRLRQETGELRRAIEERRPAVEIWSEAADVANFAAMLAANEQEQDDG